MLCMGLHAHASQCPVGKESRYRFRDFFLVLFVTVAVMLVRADQQQWQDALCLFQRAYCFY